MFVSASSKILLILALSGTAFGQSWAKVTNMGTSITVVLPAGTIYRYGGSTWCDSVTAGVKGVTLHGPPACFVNGAPATPTGTELDIQQTSSPITVTVNGEAVPVTIPAASGSTPPPPPPPVSGTSGYCGTGLATTYTITTSANFNSNGNITSGTAAMVCE